LVFAIIGFAIFYASSNQHTRYGSLFLSIPGAYGVALSMAAWVADNSALSKRKAAALAFGTMTAVSLLLYKRKANIVTKVTKDITKNR
jgi:hypothetical protein